MAKAIAILEVMWDWQNQTSSAGYKKTAPTHFRINPENFTGKRLYWLLGHTDLLVTNACPELVSNAKARGKPDHKWLKDNLINLHPYDLVLVCGRVAQDTFDQIRTQIRHYEQGQVREVYLPHPAARLWSNKALAFTRRLIQQGSADIQLSFARNELGIVAKPLPPF